VSCAKRAAEPIDLPFGLWTRVGRRIHKFNGIRQVAPVSLIEGHVDATWRIRLNHPFTVAMQLLRPLVIFGHAHLDSRTDSRALRPEYCLVDIPHNTAIYFAYVCLQYRRIEKLTKLITEVEDRILIPYF